MKNLEKMTWEEAVERFAGQNVLMKVYSRKKIDYYQVPEDFDILIVPETKEERKEVAHLRVTYPDEYDYVFIPFTSTYQGWKTYRGL